MFAIIKLYFHCSVHLYPISLNFRRSSKVQGCIKRDYWNICAVFFFLFFFEKKIY